MKSRLGLDESFEKYLRKLANENKELREQVARSRRLMTAGGAAAVAGPVVLLALILGLVAFTPARVLVALALAIGGIVLMGSSRSSTEQLERSLERAEAQRNAAIDALGLTPAGETEAVDPAGRTALPKRLP